MREKLKGIQSRLVFIYTGILSVFVVCAFSFVVYESYRQYEKEVEQNLETTADSMLMQIDNYVNHADFILVDMISNKRLISLLKEIRKEGISDQMETYYRRNEVCNCIITQSSTRMLYRLSVFTENGFFASTKSQVSNGFSIDRFSWTQEVREKKGGMVLTAPHKDTWDADGALVVTVARLVRDPVLELGILEGQVEYKKIDEICQNASQYQMVIQNQKQEIFYENGVNGGTEDTHRKHRLSYTAKSDLTGLECTVAKEISILDPGVRLVWTLGIVIVFLAAFFSSVVVYWFVQRTTQPLLELKEVLENTDLETLSQNHQAEEIHSDVDEIKSLIHSFCIMNTRLADSLRKERRAYQMQMTAKFEALQAQINPHFIHNILNVIVNMAYEEKIGDIPAVCNRLSENIRYSTSTREQTATLREELRFVENYLILMKKRFEYKLEYELVLADDFEEMVRLPKLTLIPFVENAVYHPYYESGERIIRIRIETEQDENYWYFRIRDNGKGFKPGQIEELTRKIERYFGQLGQDEVEGMEIGGLGIVNTCARLKLFSQGTIETKLLNSVDGGAIVVIKGRKTDGQDHGSRG